MISCTTGRVISLGLPHKSVPPVVRITKKESNHHRTHVQSTILEAAVEWKLNSVANCLKKYVMNDDDSTMRSHCTNAKEGGKLKDDIPTPLFLADPGHRIKLMGKDVFGVVQKTKNQAMLKTSMLFASRNIILFIFRRTKQKVFKIL